MVQEEHAIIFVKMCNSISPCFFHNVESITLKIKDFPHCSNVLIVQCSIIIEPNVLATTQILHTT